MKSELLGMVHVVLRVRSLDVRSHFYCDVLGCPFGSLARDLGIVHLRVG